MKQARELIERDLRPLFWKYALPSITMMLIMSIYFLVDAIFIGRGVGSDALGAVNLIIPFMILSNSLTMSLAISASIIISIYLSKKLFRKANNTFTNIIIINSIISTLFTSMGLIFSNKIALLLGATPDIIGMVVEYLSIILYFIFFFTMQATLTSIIRNDGNPNLAMFATILGSLINIPLDALFIFGFGWGLKGAALATGLSQVTAVVILSLHFVLKKGHLRFVFPVFDFKEDKIIFINAIPIMFGNIFLPISTFLMNTIASRTYGTLGISAYAIVATITMFIISIFNGIAQGIQPIISFNHGQNQAVRIKGVLMLGIKNMIIFGIIFIALIILLTDQIISLFTTESITSPLFKLTRTALRVNMLGFVFIGFNSILASYFQSIQHIRRATIINTFRTFIILIPVSLLIPVLPDKYIWSTIVVSEILSFAIIMGIYSKNYGDMLNNGYRLQRN